MAVLVPLTNLLEEVPDPRRAEGKLYKRPHVLLPSPLAIVTGCSLQRGIVTFIDVHRRSRNAFFGPTWRRARAHTALVLAPVDIAEKSKEIPAVQALLAELGLARHLVTLDAWHCQRTIPGCR